MHEHILLTGRRKFREVKLPTTWTDEKQRWEESEKRGEEKKKEDQRRESQKKEDQVSGKIGKSGKILFFQ